MAIAFLNTFNQFFYRFRLIAGWSEGGM